MKASLSHRTLTAVVALGALFTVGTTTGCADDRKKDVAATDAGTSDDTKKPVLGGKLGAAVQAAESAQPAPAKATDGPPESGVFAAGEADKQLGPGGKPKVDVIAEGKAPTFAFTLAPPSEQREVASITVHVQGATVPIEYGLAFKIDKPKDDKGGPASSYRVVGKVAAVGFPPQVTGEIADRLNKLKGTEIRYTLSAAAGASDASYATPKDVDPGLADLVVKGLLDAVMLASPPLPPKPVGVGGYWIATDRASVLGVDVIRYRVYTVEKIDGNVATLSLQTRQYAAKEDVDLGAIAKGQKLTVSRFDSSGLSKLEWSSAAILAPHAETSLKTALQGTVGGGQQAGLQAELIGRFAIDDKKR